MYFGDLANLRVFGNLKVVEVLTLTALEEFAPFNADFFADCAFTVEEAIVSSLSVVGREKQMKGGLGGK